MQLCWKVNMHDRPGFSDLKNALSTLRTQQQSVGVVNLNIDLLQAALCQEGLEQV